MDKARPVLFHEGRIVLKEDGGRPFGKVELPREDAIAASGPVTLKGWALADKGLAKVYAALISESGQPGVLTAEARFGLEARPDIEGTYVLYPGILEAGWSITLDRKALPPGSGSSARFEIVAVDNDGRKAVLGRRKIFSAGLKPGGQISNSVPYHSILHTISPKMTGTLGGVKLPFRRVLTGPKGDIDSFSDQTSVGCDTVFVVFY